MIPIQTDQSDLVAAVAASPMEVTLDAVIVLVPRDTITATIRGKWHPDMCAALAARADGGVPAYAFEARITNMPARDRTWVKVIPITSGAVDVESSFPIPVQELARGHHELELFLVEPGGQAPFPNGRKRSQSPSVIKMPLRRVGTAATLEDSVGFCSLDMEPPPVARSHSAPAPQRYLSFLTDTLQQLEAHQCARLGGGPDGVPFITVTGNGGPGYLSLGFKKGDRGYHIERPFEFHPVQADLAVWPFLEKLSDVTGDGRYRAWVREMAAAFAQHGFHPRSGLAYFGVACRLDVVNLRRISTSFKPGPGMPLDRLWEQAPDQMARMMKSMYYGLVTRQETMDYNRHCPYDFDDRDRKPVMAFNPKHMTFVGSGAQFIHWWGTHFARTGDRVTLGWARTMAAKWLSMQHPESGLIPYFYYAAGTLSDSMTPCEFVSTDSASMAAVALFQASSEFAKSADPDAVSFARQLRTMALNIARGVARYGYDSDRGVFRQYLGHDGSPFQDPARYTFPTQAQKEEAMKTDPSVKDAVVYDGSGFYEPGPYSLHSAGSDIPWEIAWCARESRDPCLIQQTRAFAELAVTASARVQRPFTREWKWTFRASGFYIRVMTTLFELTGERPYLDWAQSLADAEMENLGRVRYPEWWRFPERLEFLEGVLSICAALRNG